MTPRELAEREGKPIALTWIDAAVSALQDHVAARLKGGDGSALVRSALETNFSLRHERHESPYALIIVAMFTRARRVLEQSHRYFFDVAEPEARRLFGDDLPPAYAIFERGVYFTSGFTPHDPETGRGFGHNCRAAMVLHESVHVFDRRSGEPAIHISEWDEPGFSAQTFEESLHNPSAYASFGAQIFTGSRTWSKSDRYGAGRPAC